MKSIQAINDMVVVDEITKEEEKTEAGIIVPSIVKMEPQKYGKVLSIGSDVEGISVGDIVVFHQAGGQAIYMNGVVGRVLKSNEIYGILQ
jgi:co-chaperonin GroES (HSP10)